MPGGEVLLARYLSKENQSPQLTSVEEQGSLFGEFGVKKM